MNNFCKIPVREKGKEPLIKWKEFQEVFPSNNQIEVWEKKYPNCNWAVVTGKISNIVVLDFDSEEAYQFFRSKGLPDSPTVKTSRGYHVYLKYSLYTSSLQSVCGRSDVQLKSDGGCVMFVGSIHPSGHIYYWIKNYSLEDLPLADLPDWAMAEGNRNKEPMNDLLKGVGQGERNNTLARLAGLWINSGASLEDCFQMALGWNQLNHPAMSDGEVEQTVKSIYKRHTDELFNQEKECLDIPPPMEINEFLAQDIPPVEFWVDRIIQKEGRTMISAAPNKGKSILSSNLAVAMCSQIEEVLNQFNSARTHVLYLDMEMGKRLVFQRFQKMLSESLNKEENLFIHCLMAKNLLDKSFQQVLEKWIQDLRIEVLIIDPIGSAWDGEENDKKEVSRLTSYLDSLIDRFGASIVVVHHHRKSFKNQGSSGGEMAAGSYKWSAWVDIHVCLEGEANNLVISCQKARATEKFQPFRVKLNPETMFLEYNGNFEKKYDKKTAVEVYQAIGKEWVSYSDLHKKSKELGLAGRDKLKELVKESDLFEVKTEGKKHLIKMTDLTKQPVS